MISLGDTIKFSLSPSKKDRLSTNVSGVPLDDRNLVVVLEQCSYSISSEFFLLP